MLVAVIRMILTLVKRYSEEKFLALTLTHKKNISK